MAAEALAGLATGLVFGALLKRSRFCLTGLIRDIYLEKKAYNAILILAVIFIQGLCYQVLVLTGLIRGLTFVTPFPLIAAALGSFLFGAGAVLSSGCLTMSLVKCGDGRVAGLLSLISFICVGYFVSAGPVNMATYKFMSAAILKSPRGGSVTICSLLLCAAAAAVLIGLMGRTAKRRTKKSSAVKALFEGWPAEKTSILIGLVMGAGFWISDIFGRHYGFAIAMPVLSWFIAIFHPAAVIGGCNIYDQQIGWGSFFVVGIIAGSFLMAVKRGEYAVILPTAKNAVKAVVGGALMGIGAILGQGCLLANGLVATSQLLVRGWYALIFLVLGIWASTRLFIVSAYKK